MRKVISILLVALLIGVASCNEKPKKYKFVIVGNDGKEMVEDLSAENDTDALKVYFDRLEKVIVENIGKDKPAYKQIYVLSPEGDTLNTNKELLQTIINDLPMLKEPAEKVPATPAPEQ